MERSVRRFGVTSSPKPAVPAGGPPDEPAVLVEERDAQPVDLGLAHVGERGPGERPREPRLELAQVALAGRVVQGEHGRRVLDRGEGVRHHARDTLGRGVGRDELGVARLELAELPGQGVVLGVGDLGAVEGVVEVVVAGDQPAQLVDALAGRLGSPHGQRIARPARPAGRRGPGPTRARARCPAPEREQQRPDAQRDGEPEGGRAHSRVAAAASGSGVPSPTRSAVRLPSATPSPPGSMDTAPPARRRRRRRSPRRAAASTPRPCRMSQKATHSKNHETTDRGAPRPARRREERAPAVDELARGLDNRSGRRRRTGASDGRSAGRPRGRRARRRRRPRRAGPCGRAVAPRPPRRTSPATSVSALGHHHGRRAADRRADQLRTSTAFSISPNLPGEIAMANPARNTRRLGRQGSGISRRRR